MSFRKLLPLVLAGVFMLTAGALQASAATITVDDGSGHAATAVLTFSAGSLTIKLTNDTDNDDITSGFYTAGNLLTGFAFNASPTGLALTGGGTGTTVTATSTSSFPTFGGSQDIEWSLGTLGGNPAVDFNPQADLAIIGKEGASGKYDKGNASIFTGSHNPLTYLTGTFVITGFTENSSITSVVFYFGTEHQFNVTHGCTDCTPDTQDSPGGNPVPEPASLLLLGTAMAGGARMLRNRRASK